MIELWSQRRNAANESANVIPWALGKVFFGFVCDFYFLLHIFIDMGLLTSYEDTVRYPDKTI